MDILDSPLFSTILALAATFLGLSLLVQVIQEVYKFITKSKARAYNLALLDFAGPWISKLYQPGIASDLVFRGPFQVFKRRPTGKLLPMAKENLIKTLTRTAPDWHRIALKNIEAESTLQAGKEQAPSLAWNHFLERLARVEKGSTGYWNSQEIIRFLEAWDHKFRPDKAPEGNSVEAPKSLNANSLMTAFREEFFSHLDHIDEYYEQFMENFEHTYRRQNLRITFIIGLLLAIGFNMPIDELYQSASRVSATESINQANEFISLYSRLAAPSQQSDTTMAMLQTQTDIPDSLMVQVQHIIDKLGTAMKKDRKPFSIDWSSILSFWQADFTTILRSLFGCVITALLISFGAPFWNDLAGSLIRLKRPK